MTVAARPAAVAGHFYPDQPEVLAAEIDRHLAGAGDHGLAPVAVIAPHAGYRYSGPVAASVYRGLTALRGRVTRVVLLGPAHRVGHPGLALPAAAAFDTPLGPVAVDAGAQAALAGLPHVTVDDAPHAPEHSLEVHLPFLLRTLGDVAVVPLTVGDATPHQVADVIERLWDPGTLVVVSSDLSHYHDYETARRLDAATTAAIESLRYEHLARDSACGVVGVAGLLLAARRRALRPVTLDVRNSGDTEGGKDRVVGYGAWAFVDEPPAPLEPDEGERLVDLAWATVAYAARGGRAGEPDLDGLPTRLRRRQAAFVTLRSGDDLRGCIGGVEATDPLAAAVVRAAQGGATGDPRFPPVGPDELAGLDLSVTALSPLARLAVASRDELVATLVPGTDGLMLTEGARQRAVFLPQVWDELPDPDEFVARLAHKGGMDPKWDPTRAAYRFRAESFARA